MKKKAVQNQKKEDGFDRLARLIKEEADDIRGTMATKKDIKDMATKGDIKDMATKGDIASLYRMMATKEDIVELRRELKEHVTLEVDGLREELRPQERSLDKTVLTVADHEIRISNLER